MSFPCLIAHLSLSVPLPRLSLHACFCLTALVHLARGLLDHPASSASPSGWGPRPVLACAPLVPRQCEALAEALIQNLAWRRGKTPTYIFSEAHSCEKTQVWVQTPLKISRGVEVKHQQVHFQMRARARKHRVLVLAYFKISRGVEVKHQQVHFQDAIFSASMSKSPPQHPNVLVLVPS